MTVDTLDNFCTTNGIPRIGYLKIDTEGSDLDVLCGATDLLRQHAVDVIQVEVGMSRRNTWHVPLGDFIAFLSPRGYELFVITEQHRSYTPPAPYLDRADAVFVSPRHNPAALVP